MREKRERERESAWRERDRFGRDIYIYLEEEKKERDERGCFVSEKKVESLRRES